MPALPGHHDQNVSLSTSESLDDDAFDDAFTGGFGQQSTHNDAPTFLTLPHQMAANDWVGTPQWHQHAGANQQSQRRSPPTHSNHPPSQQVAQRFPLSAATNSTVMVANRRSQTSKNGGKTPPAAVQDTPQTGRPTIASLQEQIAEHIADKAALQQTVVELQAENRQLTKELKKVRKNAVSFKANKEVIKNCKQIYVTHIFRVCKWIRNKTEAIQVAERIYDIMFTEEERKEKGAEHKVTWVNTYEPHQKTGVNGRRSYIQSQTKLAVFAYYRKFKKMPTLALILKCVTRDINLKNKEEYNIFHWFWNDAAGKYFAIAKFFCPTI